VPHPSPGAKASVTTAAHPAKSKKKFNAKKPRTYAAAQKAKLLAATHCRLIRERMIPKTLKQASVQV
jgi:hypothetical protein